MVASAARIRPYKKQTRSSTRGWIEEAFRMGVTRPKHLLDKKVEESDSKVQQQRLLFPRGFKESLIKNGFIWGEQEAAMLEDTGRGVNLKVLDGEGRKYNMVMKVLKCNKQPRIIGSDWRKFLDNNNLDPKKHGLSIYAFRADDSRRQRYMNVVWNNQQLWLAIVKYDRNISLEEEEFNGDLQETGSEQGKEYQIDGVRMKRQIGCWKVLL